MEPARATHAVIVKAHLWRAGKCLILERHAHDDEYAGLWDIPGGRLEPGENARAGLKREVAEETGLIVERARPISVWDVTTEAKGHALGISFIAGINESETNSDKVRLSAEHRAHRWMTPEEIDAFRFAPALRREIAWIIGQGLRP